MLSKGAVKSGLDGCARVASRVPTWGGARTAAMLGRKDDGGHGPGRLVGFSGWALRASGTLRRRGRGSGDNQPDPGLDAHAGRRLVDLFHLLGKEVPLPAGEPRDEVELLLALAKLTFRSNCPRYHRVPSRSAIRSCQVPVGPNRTRFGAVTSERSRCSESRAGPASCAARVGRAADRNPGEVARDRELAAAAFRAVPLP